MVGDKLLTVATHYVQDQVNDLCIGINNIPHATSISSIGDVSEEELYILRSGVNVKIDPSITDSKILNGLRRAMTAANWKEDPESTIITIIKTSAKNGPSVSTNSPCQRVFCRRSGKTDLERPKSPRAVRRTFSSLANEVNGTRSDHSSVTQPSEALFTFLMYLKSVPRVTFKGGATQAAFRFATSSSLIKTSIRFLSASMTILSPS